MRKLKTTLKIPVLALVDSDPYGLKILSVYMKGSMNMSYDSSNLTTPDIKWLGVRPSDLDRFNIPAQCRLPMTEEDLKMGRKLVRRWGRYYFYHISGYAIAKSAMGLSQADTKNSEVK